MNGIRAIDIVVLLALHRAHEDARARPTSWLAQAMSISTKTSHDSLKRLARLRLLAPGNEPALTLLLTFITPAAPFLFPAEPGPVSGGMPTAASAAPLNGIFATTETELGFVWPDADGTERGVSVEPLHRSVPTLARSLPGFHEDVALVDGLRIWNPRIRREADRLLRARLEGT